MVTIPKVSRRVMAPVYIIPEYMDPAGSTVSGWGRDYVLSESIIELEGWDAETLMIYRQPLGDFSMYERARPGDVWLIDKADREPREGEKYLIQHRAGARVRRIFVHHDGSLLLSPDVSGPTHRPEKVDRISARKLSIIGRVVAILGFARR